MLEEDASSNFADYVWTPAKPEVLPLLERLSRRE
jgi:hypothetical protein